MQYNNNARQIVERIIVKGDLVLTSPASFGGEGSSSLVDMPVMLDPLEGKALLTGASLVEHSAATWRLERLVSGDQTSQASLDPCFTDSKKGARKPPMVRRTKALRKKQVARPPQVSKVT